MSQVTQISAWNNISATTPVVLTSHVPAGSQRKLQLILGMRNGAGNAGPPETLTIGTVSATRIAGETGDTDRVSATLWEINEAGISSLVLNGLGTGYDVAMSGQTGTVRTVLTACFENADQNTTNPNASIFTATSASATALSLARVNESLTLFVAYCNTVSTLTLTNPSRDITFTDSGNGTQFNIGYEADTEQTVDSTYSALANRVSAFVINILPHTASPSITSIEGDVTPELPDESTDLNVVTANLGTVTSGTLGGRTIIINSTGSNSCNIDFPARVDGMTWLNLPDTVNLLLTDGTFSPTLPILVTAKAGETSVSIIDADISGPGPLAYYLNQLGYSVEDGVELYYQGLDGDVVINPNTSVTLAATTVFPFTMSFWHVDLDGEWNSFEVTFTINSTVSLAYNQLVYSEIKYPSLTYNSII